MKAKDVRNWKNLSLKNLEDLAELHVFDEIGAGWYGGVTATAFAEALDEAGGRPLDVYWNSPGGSVTDGMTMFNLLSKYSNRVHSHIVGEAASIASVIPQASDKVFAGANTLMMIHDPWVLDAGNARDKRKMADLLDMVKGQILDSYLVRATASRKELSDLMESETWLTAEKAKALGLVDEVTAIGRDTKANASLVRFDGIYQNIPADALSASRAAREALSPEDRKETYEEHVKTTLLELKDSDLQLRLRNQRREFEKAVAGTEAVAYETELRRKINSYKVRD